jgi:hypothetical protein
VTATDWLWFLRSLRDQDTHRGRYSIATRSVFTECGLEFQPLRLPFGRLALPGNPPDPDQVCPRCGPRKRSGRARRQP